jgi:hypothetical protein
VGQENRFSIGAVLGTGFKIWFKNLPAFLLITIVIYIPMIVWGISAATGSAEATKSFTDYHGLADILVNMMAAAAITYGVVMELQGQHASIGASFATGLARFFPVLGVGILSALCIGLGFVLLIVPGIIVFCMFYVALPTAVLERPGLIGALHRSRELTRGHKLEIFAIWFLLALINVGTALLAQELIVKTDMSYPELMDAATVQMALNVITGSLSAVMSAVTYYYLRNEKEGTSASELARVFD